MASKMIPTLLLPHPFASPPPPRPLPMDAPASVTMTIVGNGSAGTTNGPPETATLNAPRGIALGFTIGPAAGGGNSSSSGGNNGTAAGGNRSLYWADHGSCLVRVLDAGTHLVSTVAGTICGYEDGPIASAKLGALEGLLLAPEGQ